MSDNVNSEMNECAPIVDTLTEDTQPLGETVFTADAPGTVEPPENAGEQAPAAHDAQIPAETPDSAGEQAPAAPTDDVQLPAENPDSAGEQVPAETGDGKPGDPEVPDEPEEPEEPEVIDENTRTEGKYDYARGRLNHRGRRCLNRLRKQKKWQPILKYMTAGELIDLVLMTRSQRARIFANLAMVRRVMRRYTRNDVRMEQRRSLIVKRSLERYRIAFEGAPDLRASNKTYKLAIMVAALLTAVLCGANNVKACEDFMKNNPDTVRYYLGVGADEFPNMPSDTTLSRLLASIDYEYAVKVSSEWCKTFAIDETRHIALDGKAVRAVTEIIDGVEHTVYIINVYDGTNGSFMNQLRVGAKTNEDASFPDLIDIIAPSVKGVTVTADAAFTHEDNMRMIIKAGAHFILPVKSNFRAALPLIQERFMEYVDDEDPDVQYYADSDNDKYQHGREDYREYVLITGEKAAKICEGTPFEGLIGAVGYVFRYRKVIKRDADGNEIVKKESDNVVYYVSDRSDLTAEEFGYFIRNHWYATEINHWLLDMVTNEDRSTIRNGHGLEMFSLLRKVALTLLRWLQKTVAKDVSTRQLRDMLGQARGVRADVVPIKDAARKSYIEAVLKKTEENLNQALAQEGSSPIDIYSIPEFDYAPVGTDRPLSLSELLDELQAVA